MQLNRPQTKSRGTLPSIGAVLVVAAVVAGNSWWLLRDDQTAPQMTQTERLQVLRTERNRVERAALAEEVARREGNRPDDSVAVQPNAKKLELSAAEVERQPVAPVAMPTERLVSVQPGDSLTAALQRLYIHGPTAQRVVSAYAKLRKPRRLQVGSLLFARFDSPSPMDAESLLSVVVTNKNGGNGITIERKRDEEKTTYLAKVGGIPGIRERRALRCTVTASLSRSLQRCGHEAGLATLVSSALGTRLSLRSDVRRGDEIQVIYDELVGAGKRIRYERVLAVRYRGQRSKMTGIWFGSDKGGGDWFTPEGMALEPMFTSNLVAGARLTSGFGMRLHPILKVRKMHNGMDYAAPTGTPVRAAADGIVTKTARGGAAGNHLRIRHALGYQTEYMHLSRFSRRSRRGKRVRKGQTIGYVGSTGRSTAPHLHFGVMKSGTYVDPLSIRNVAGKGVATRDRKRFEQHVTTMMKLLTALDEGDIGDT